MNININKVIKKKKGYIPFSFFSFFFFFSFCTTFHSIHSYTFFPSILTNKIQMSEYITNKSLPLFDSNSNSNSGKDIRFIDEYYNKNESILLDTISYHLKKYSVYSLLLKEDISLYEKMNLLDEFYKNTEGFHDNDSKYVSNIFAGGLLKDWDWD
jgi:hypothetical protein